MSKKDEGQRAHTTFLIWAILILLLAAAITWWWYEKQFGVLMKDGPTPFGTTEAGQIGDSFGPWTSLFTSVALGMAVLSTWFQVREFSKQLEEMRESKVEMVQQTATYKAQLTEAQNQTNLLRAQRFDDQLNHHVSNLPFLAIIFSRFGDRRVQVTIRNTGSTIYTLDIECSHQLAWHHGTGFGTGRKVSLNHKVAILGKGMADSEQREVVFELLLDEPHRSAFFDGEFPIDMTISYDLPTGMRNTECFGNLQLGECSSVRSRQVADLRQSMSEADPKHI